MCLVCKAGYAATGMVILATTSGLPHVATLSQVKIDSELISSHILALEELPQTVANFKMPAVKEPSWLQQQNAAEAAAKAAQKSATKNVTYSVTTRGAVRANLAEFKSQANASLNDPRGWPRMGVSFQEVAEGGMFTLVLSEASQLPSFSPGCGTEYSCRAGRYVIINQDRWLGATSSWNQAKGTLRDYRHMVINHETGHWLGHDHEQCGGAGQAASVMQQQSINLQGCSFNPWPLESELWSTQLGIRRA